MDSLKKIDGFEELADKNAKAALLLKKRIELNNLLKNAAKAKISELALNKRYSLRIDIPSYYGKGGKSFPKRDSVANDARYLKINDYYLIHSDYKYLTDELFEQSGEILYKVFPALSGHMMGENEHISVILSSHAIYFVTQSSVIENKLKTKLLYEDILAIIVGSFERWLTFIKKGFTCHSSIYEREENVVQIELTNQNVTTNLISYFELATRRRIQTMLLKEQKKSLFIDSTRSYFHVCHRKARHRFTSSVGRIADYIVPCVMSAYPDETEFIKHFLLNEHVLKSDSRILHCWLVFWENGSAAVSEDDNLSEVGPQLEGHLMINLPLLQTWVPSYFILKGGILYQFLDPSDPMPHSFIVLSKCCGCSRLTSGGRPYGFQIARLNEPPVLLAAPNEQTASQWLQAILRALCCKAEQRAKRRFVPCQLIQTTSGLVLTHQSAICQLNSRKLLSLHHKKPAVVTTNPTVDNARNFTCHDKFSRQSSSRELSICPGSGKTTKHLLKEEKVKEKNEIMKERGGVKEMELKKNRMKEENRAKTYPSATDGEKSDIDCLCKDNYETVNLSDNDLTIQSTDTQGRESSQSCLPTPPPVTLPPNTSFYPKKPPKKQDIDAKDPPFLQILSSANYSQISEIVVHNQSRAIFVEFECNEAYEMALDWALYFLSEIHLSNFMSNFIEKGENTEQVSVSYSAVGNITRFLQEGSSIILRQKSLSSVPLSFP